MTRQPSELERTNDDNILARVRLFNGSLDRLMQLYTTNSLPLSAFLTTVTEEASTLLHTQRVSIWALEESETKIYCSDLYLVETDEHLNGGFLLQQDFPKYFEAMLSKRVIDAVDAANDPRTAEFKHAYLQPNNIQSMLDAQIRSAAGPRGVICIESVNYMRQWTPDEVAYAASLAELVGFAMDRQERLQVAIRLAEVNEQLHTAKHKADEINERYNLAIDAAFEGIWDWNIASGVVHFSKQNFILLGYDSPSFNSDIISDSTWWEEKVHSDDIADAKNAINCHFKNNTPYDITYRIQHCNGNWRWWRSRGKVIRDQHNQPRRFVGTNSDVTKLIETKKELERRNLELVETKKEVEIAALHDRLTGLPNRRFLETVLSKQIEHAKLTNNDVAFLHIDLDHFKEVNDTLGHAAGDFVLEHVAKILKAKLEDYHIARIGGDEFVAVIPDKQNTQPWHNIAKQIVAALNLPIYFGETACKVGASIGIAELGNENCDAAELLLNADIALYAAKRLGRNRYEVFTHSMRVEIDEKKQLHSDIIYGLKHGQFVPFFQPQFCSKTLSICGVESLVRWHHPKKGILSPDTFLGAIEELDYLAALDALMLEKSVETLTSWQQQGVTVPRLSVNVSASRLSDPNLIDNIHTAKVQHSALCFELLESIFLAEYSTSITRNIESLNKLGVKLDIDDFGTGSASIANLLEVKPERLKINRTLVKNIENDNNALSLIRSIVDIANTLRGCRRRRNRATDSHAHTHRLPVLARLCTG